MDFLSNRKEDERIPRPVSVAQPTSVTTNQASQRQSAPKTNKLIAVVVTVLVIIALVTGAWLLFGNRMGAAAIKKDAYQAVFLTNDQVYFGKVDNINGDYLTMSNIYYLQAQQAVQPDDSKNAAPATADSTGNVQLIKLGNELHGPEDQLHISNKQVLFWENLKADGKVSQAIEKYKADNK